MIFETFLEICICVGFAVVITLIYTVVRPLVSWFTHKILFKKKQKRR